MKYIFCLYLLMFLNSFLFPSSLDWVQNDDKLNLLEELPEKNAKIDWTKGLLRVEVSIPQIDIKENIGKLQTEIESRIREELYTKLSRALGYVRLFDPFLVRDYYLNFPELRYEVSSYLEKAFYYPVVKRKNGYYGYAELPLFGEKGFVDIFFRNLPMKSETKYLNESQDIQYFDTLILDMLVFKDFKPSIGMRIYDEDGTLLYGPETVDKEVFKKGGLCIYTKSLSYAFSSPRSGSRIFYTIPAGIRGKLNSDIILFNSDAKKLFSSKRTINYLNKGNIIIVKP